jgi:hypothetical protein
MSSKFPDCFPLTREKALEEAIYMRYHTHHRLDVLKNQAEYVEALKKEISTAGVEAFKKEISTAVVEAFKDEKISTAVVRSLCEQCINNALLADRAYSDPTTDRTVKLKTVLSNSFKFLEGTVGTEYSVAGRHLFSFRYDREDLRYDRKDLHMTVTYKSVSQSPLYDYFHFVRRMLIRVDVITNIYPELTAAFLLNADEPIDENSLH